MGILQNLLKGNEQKREFRQKFKEAQEELKIQRMVEERQKSSNERELDKYMKQQREDRIKSALDKIHKQENKELWKTKNTILGEKTTMLKDDRPILKEKNIFKGNENMFTKEHAIKKKSDMGFFK